LHHNHIAALSSRVDNYWVGEFQDTYSVFSPLKVFGLKPDYFPELWEYRFDF